MLLFFVDDSRQNTPSREGMQPLVAAGAIAVPEPSIRVLELQLEKLCSEAGFPDGEEFKWSPGRELWMSTNLIDNQRADFFQRVLEAAANAGVITTVVISEATAERVTAQQCSAEIDVTGMLLERIQFQTPFDQQASIVADRPSGDRREEDRFVAACLTTVKKGTRLLRNFDLIALFLTTNSKLVRLLQLADLITSCTLAYVSGENRFAPQTFRHIRPLLRSDGGRVGGVGLKIHPEAQYANLYHWLAGDDSYILHNARYPLPLPGQPFAAEAERR
jgi:hypothetical protein